MAGRGELNYRFDRLAQVFGTGLMGGVRSGLRFFVLLIICWRLRWDSCLAGIDR